MHVTRSVSPGLILVFMPTPATMGGPMALNLKVFERLAGVRVGSGE